MRRERARRRLVKHNIDGLNIRLLIDVGHIRQGSGAC
jgi:hypothetical protein